MTIFAYPQSRRLAAFLFAALAVFAKPMPTLLLLHGFPSSSRMYEPLLTRLAEALKGL